MSTILTEICMVNDVNAILEQAIAAHNAGDFATAEMLYREAISRHPNHALAIHNFGTLALNLGQSSVAVGLLQRAVAIDPSVAAFHISLALTLTNLGQTDLAIESLRNALRLEPDSTDAAFHLAVALADSGNVESAVETFRRLIDFPPHAEAAHSGLLYLLHFLSQSTPQSLHDEHRVWNERFARHLASRDAKHSNDRSPNRRLRVGYISPDFRSHPVGRFISPLLGNHDRTMFETFCYSNTRAEDLLTDRIRQSASAWRNIASLSDDQVCEMIREDRIDILVDLTMHMANNRLNVFARKPAPVQVTYLAYCGTTGLDAIDYRLTDEYLDPDAQRDSFYAERSIRLAKSYWCYVAVTEGDPGPLPSSTSGIITFGSLNSFIKVSNETIDVWARVLHAVENSRLLVHAYVGSHREKFSERMATNGIDVSRIEFVGLLPVYDYFDQYRRIDIALDSSPYTGGTTTCDALWMGVPVVSLVGQTGVSRSGLSILSNIARSEWAADSVERYIEIAKALAADSVELAEIRRGLREQMRSSPLMDPVRFSRDVESAFRSMWQRWCADQDRDASTITAVP